LCLIVINNLYTLFRDNIKSIVKTWKYAYFALFLMRALRNLLFFILISIWQKSVSASFTPSEIAQLLCKANGELIGDYNNPFLIDEATYLVLGDSFIINPQGTHHVFTYTKERGTFSRIDRSIFHGHNFGRKIFVYRDEIYSIGGYGFWQTHGRLMRFSWNTREWELVMLKGVVPTGMPAVAFVKGDSLYVFHTVEKHSETGTDSVSRLAYIIDLLRKTSSRFLIANNRHFESYGPAWNNQYSKYVIFGSPGELMHIVDKEKFIIYSSIAGPSLFKGYPEKRLNSLDSNFAVLEGDNIWVYPKNSPPIQYSVMEFAELYCTSGSLHENLVPYPDGENQKVNNQSIIYIILCFAIGIVLIIWVTGKAVEKFTRLREIRWANAYDLLKQEPYYAEIRMLNTGIYSEKEIDLAFRIRHMQKSVRNLKRSTYIQELNRMQPGFIETVKSTPFAKHVYYEINKI